MTRFPLLFLIDSCMHGEQISSIILHMFYFLQYLSHSKHSEILNTFLFVFSSRMLAMRGGIHKILLRIANIEDPDQTATSEAVQALEHNTIKQFL